MPRIKTTKRGRGGSKGPSTWQQTLTERIKLGKVLPLLSNRVNNDLILHGHEALVKAYADYIHYPLPQLSLPPMAQFKRVTDEAITDDWQLKADYINFVKNRLFDIAETEEISADILAEVEEEFDDIDFAEFSERLGYPKFDQAQSNALLTLASFPLPIYLTTSYHNFIEVALKHAGKEPRAEICCWHKGLEAIPSGLDDDYEPTVQEPLVYHLHGLDRYPDSLVVTEDDYLEFLVAISQNVGRGTDRIPLRVRQAMADSSLILLGYGLRSWDFRVLFWGLIEPRPRQPMSVSIQLAPDDVEKNYLQKYLSAVDFEVYWGDIDACIKELHQNLEG